MQGLARVDFARVKVAHAARKDVDGDLLGGERLPARSAADPPGRRAQAVLRARSR
jgi:hypothetical protein